MHFFNSKYCLQKEIYPNSGVYFYNSEIEKVEMLSSLKGERSWRKLTKHALLQIYGLNLYNYCAKGQSGEHPG